MVIPPTLFFFLKIAAVIQGHLFLSLFFQIDFQFLALSLLLLAPLWCEYWNAWSCPRGCLYYPHFFVCILFSLLLFPCKLFFISISVSFIFYWIFFFMLLRSSLNALSTPITSVLNSASDRSIISICSFFLEFWSVFLFGPCFFVFSFWQPPCVCFYVLDRAAMTPGLGIVA